MGDICFDLDVELNQDIHRNGDGDRFNYQDLFNVSERDINFWMEN